MSDDSTFIRLKAVVEHLERQAEGCWAQESRKRAERGHPRLRRTAIRPEAALTMYRVCPVCGEAQGTLDKAKTLVRSNRRREVNVDLCQARLDELMPCQG